MRSFETRKAGSDDREPLLGLFEACGCTCFCRYWHFEGDKNAWLERLFVFPDRNRDELTAALDAEHPSAQGVVAWADGELAGWLKLVPADAAPKAYVQRFYRGLACFSGDRSGVLLLGCMLVRPTLRRQGVAAALVDAALRLAVDLGATAVEAMPRRTRDAVTDEELWMGPLSTLARAGFVEIGGEGPYPVMRRPLP